MDEMMQKLEDYLERLKQQGAKIPKWTDKKTPHLRVISAASGVPYGQLSAGPLRRRIGSAVREIGLEDRRNQARNREAIFDRKCALLNEYFSYLERGGFNLPEVPKSGGEVFFAQVEVEAGLPQRSLSLIDYENEHDNNTRLRRLVGSAASRLGLGVRVLPRSPATELAPLTYERFIERGSTERKKELSAKSNARQQLYNTRSALNQFCKSSGLEMTDIVGTEFLTDFENKVERITGGIKSSSSRKKFQTEIRWWHDFYRRLINARSLPAEFNRALSTLISDSGLPLSVLAKLAGISSELLGRWYRGTSNPEPTSFPAIHRLEQLFGLLAGSLVNRITRAGKRFRPTQMPAFLQLNPQLRRRVGPHLPDNFCDLTASEQEEVVTSIKSNILRCYDPFTENVRELANLPYRLKDWPERLEEEFNDLAAFKMADRPPLGMQRNERWRPTTARKVRQDLSFLLGAVLLHADAKDKRHHGLGMRAEDLSLGLLACPLVVDWYIRFRARRTQYTSYTISLLEVIRALLRPGTGWVRQQPYLASRLTAVRCGDTELISQETISRAQGDWSTTCEEARKYYKHLIKELSPLIGVARDPFFRIEPVLRMKGPLSVFETVIEGMGRDTPNQFTQPVRYHAAIRNKVVMALLAVTGFRVTTLVRLDFTGEPGSHLFLQNKNYMLNVPRALFKEEDSPFFGPKNSRTDYVMRLPKAYGLYHLLDEYLNISRPWLMQRYQPGCKEHPLFPISRPSQYARLRPVNIHQIYKKAITKYLVENRWRGTGIPGVKPTGPHSARHIRATDTLKKTRSFQLAADSIHNSERTTRARYTMFLTTDRNDQINEILFGED